MRSARLTPTKKLIFDNEDKSIPERVLIRMRPVFFELSIDLESLRRPRKYDMDENQKELYVYILLQGAEIIYVGFSWAPHLRFRAHQKKFSGFFDSALIVRKSEIQGTEESMRRLECSLIRTLRPPLNGAFRPRPRRKFDKNP